MAVYCVSYDLHRPGQDYSKLIEELESSPDWWHYLESTWLISTNESPDQVWNRIGKHLDKNDRALIIQVGPNCQGWLPQEAYAWIRTKFAPTPRYF